MRLLRLQIMNAGFAGRKFEIISAISVACAAWSRPAGGRRQGALNQSPRGRSDRRREARSGMTV